MTVPEDRETIALCEQHGIEYRLSTTLDPDGKNFHATLYKSSVLNEGLDALDPCGWALILDADVRLPRNFRERLDAQSLESGALYGTAGRRICLEREMFEMLVECEPWDRFCSRYSGVIGFFQLFDLEHPRNRYLPSNPPGEGPGDDDQFQLIFPPENRRMLPMTVLHVGKSYVNWGGRTQDRFDLLPRSNASHDDGGMMCEVFRGRVALAGYYPGMRVNRWLAQCERVDLLDHFQVHQLSGDPVVEADRAVLRRLWAVETAELSHLHPLGPHSKSSLAQIPDHSLDVLHLPGEVTPDWLTAALPHWLAKIREGGVICGELFGLPHWPDSTHALTMLLGVPDAVAPNGFWWKRVTRTEMEFDGRFPSAHPLPVSHVGGNGEGVFFTLTEHGEIEKLLVSLHTLRRFWSGTVTVLYEGAENHALQIACARYAVECQCAGESGTMGEGRERALIAPFTRSLCLAAGTLVLGPLDLLFQDADGKSDEAAEWPLLAIRAAGKVRTFPLPSLLAEKFSGSKAGAGGPLLLCTGQPEAWTEASWATWCDAEAEMSSALAARIRVGKSMDIVTIVDAGNAADFERAWLTWNFAPQHPVLVLLDGIDEGDFWLAGERRPSAMIRIPSDACNDAADFFCFFLENALNVFFC